MKIKLAINNEYCRVEVFQAPVHGPMWNCKSVQLICEKVLPFNTRYPGSSSTIIINMGVWSSEKSYFSVLP